MSDVPGQEPELPDDDDDDDLEVAFVQYLEAGLRMPPVPRDLANALVAEDEWLYATEPLELEDRASFLAAARLPTTPARVAFGHSGHGVESWYLYYQLIDGPLAVFARLRFGGAAGDPAESRASANWAMERIEELVVQAAAAQEAGRLDAARRLVLVLDEQEEGGWEITGDPGGWHGTDAPIAEAARHLAG